MTAPVTEWARQNLRNLSVADIGPGIHFVQEDNPPDRLRACGIAKEALMFAITIRLVS